MGQKQERKRWETRKLLDPAFNTKAGVVKINTGNTLEHELAKFLLCWEIAKEGKEFVTEAIFKNKKRADILILDDQEAWEVLHTEDMERFRKKQEEYPCEVYPHEASKVIMHYLSVLRQQVHARQMKSEGEKDGSD